MTEATRPDPDDQPVVLVVDEVQDLWDRKVRLRPDAPWALLAAANEDHREGHL